MNNFILALENNILQAVSDWAKLVTFTYTLEDDRDEDFIETMRRSNEISERILQMGKDYNSIQNKYYFIIGGRTKLKIGACRGSDIKNVLREEESATFEETTKEEYTKFRNGE